MPRVIRGIGQALGLHGLLQALQARRLRLAAAFGERLGEVGEQHREPQPDRDVQDEPGRRLAVARERLEPESGGENAADVDDEHHGIAPLHARVELAQRVDDRRSQQRPVEHRKLPGG